MMTIHVRGQGQVGKGGVVTYPVPKRLAQKIKRISLWPDGRVHVYATERLDDAVLRVGELEVALTWNDSRTPARAEGQAGRG